MPLATALRQFPLYDATNATTRLVQAGATIDVADDLVAGLVASRLISMVDDNPLLEESTSAVAEASADDDGDDEPGAAPEDEERSLRERPRRENKDASAPRRSRR